MEGFLITGGRHLHQGRDRVVVLQEYLLLSSRQSSAYSEGINLGYNKNTLGDRLMLNFHDHKAVRLLAA